MSIAHIIYGERSLALFSLSQEAGRDGSEIYFTQHFKQI